MLPCLPFFYPEILPICGCGFIKLLTIQNTNMSQIRRTQCQESRAYGIASTRSAPAQEQPREFRRRHEGGQGGEERFGVDAKTCQVSSQPLINSIATNVYLCDFESQSDPVAAISRPKPSANTPKNTAKLASAIHHQNIKPIPYHSSYDITSFLCTLGGSLLFVDKRCLHVVEIRSLVFCPNAAHGLLPLFQSLLQRPCQPLPRGCYPCFLLGR